MIDRLNELIEKELNELKPSKVVDAMEYSLLSGGKRMRPHLLLSLVSDFGVVSEEAYYAAFALECIHTYSLIHDDLPALDNDDMRRFKPTNHKVYGEDIAILAGDGLLTLAFSLLAKAKLDYRFVEILGRNAGVQGMILGQEYDILNEIKSLEDLETCYKLKTGALFATSFEMAVLLAGHDEHLELAKELGYTLGIAFQFQDDLLEVLGSEKTIGKSTQSDAERNKFTITSYLSIEKSQTYIQSLFNNVDAMIAQMNLDNNNLETLINNMLVRSL